MERMLYFFGSLIFIVLGIGHILIYFFLKTIFCDYNFLIYDIMLSYDIRVFGFTRNFKEYMDGFSFTMGAFMVFYGTLNLLLIKKLQNVILKIHIVNLFNSLVALSLVLLSLIYFHWPPIICFSVSAICFFVIFLKNTKNDQYN